MNGISHDQSYHQLLLLHDLDNKKYQNLENLIFITLLIILDSERAASLAKKYKNSYHLLLKSTSTWEKIITLSL